MNSKTPTMHAEELKAGLTQANIQQGTSVIVKTNPRECDMDVKKKRNSFTCFQKVELEEIFFHNAYPTRKACEYLADRFGTSVHSVKIWFKNRRARQKKDIVPYPTQPAFKTNGFDLERQLQVPNSSQSNYSLHKGLGVSPWVLCNQQFDYNLCQHGDGIGAIRKGCQSAFSIYHKAN